MNSSPEEGKSPIHFDRAVTSWPKLPEAMRAVARFLEEVGASSERPAHRLLGEAGHIVHHVREALAGSSDVCVSPCASPFARSPPKPWTWALRGCCASTQGHRQLNGMQ